MAFTRCGCAARIVSSSGCAFLLGASGGGASSQGEDADQTTDFSITIVATSPASANAMA